MNKDNCQKLSYKSKILLINPLWSFQNYPPINLVELASYLMNNKIKNVKILDLNFEIKNKLKVENVIACSVKKVLSNNPKIVAITCNAVQFPFVCELSKELKRQKQDIPLIIGGVMPSLNPMIVLKQSNTDYVIKGEGEETFTELIKSIINDTDKKNVAGISYKNSEGKFYHNKPRQLLDITKLPIPDFSLIKDNLKQNKLVWLLASRGCAYKCKFCSGNSLWHYQRRKNIDDIYKQIYILKTEYQITDFIFGDDCLTLDKQWVIKLCQKIKSLKIKWGCLSKIDSIDIEILHALKKAGCTQIYHGIESGNPNIRKNLGKQISNNKFIINTIKEELKIGFKITCSFMTGIPFETKNDIKHTYKLAKKLKKMGIKIQLWLLTPYYGLQIIKDYKKQLIEIDRVKENLQFDIFDKGQFYLYRNFIKKYEKYNPDHFMFLPKDMTVEEFTSYFHKVQNDLKLNIKNIELSNKEIFVLKNSAINNIKPCN